MDSELIFTVVLWALLIAVVVGVVALFRRVGFWRASLILAGLAAAIWWGPPGHVYRNLTSAMRMSLAISDAKQICDCLYHYRLNHGHLPPSIDEALAEAIEPAKGEQLRLYRRSPDWKWIAPTPYLYFPQAGESPEDLLLAAPFPVRFPGRNVGRRLLAFGSGQVRFVSESQAGELIQQALTEGEGKVVDRLIGKSARTTPLRT